MADPEKIIPSFIRFMAFVDFWNLQLTINEVEEAAGGGPKFNLDWTKFPKVLFEKSSELLGAKNTRYEGMIVITSYNKASPGDKNSHGKALTTLLF